jgi:hypothetical protein
VHFKLRPARSEQFAPDGASHDEGNDITRQRKTLWQRLSAAAIACGATTRSVVRPGAWYQVPAGLPMHFF